jgi:hypothetical protein
LELDDVFDVNAGLDFDMLMVANGVVGEQMDRE